jgi:hypothetical protein
METYTLRWSADRSLYFVEPSRGRNVRGFGLGVEKKEFPVPPEIIKNPYSGAFAFRGYWRQWFSMRGFIVQQSDPQLHVPAGAELVSDYMNQFSHLVTLEEAQQIIETNRIEAAAAAKQAQQEAAAQEAAETAAREEAAEREAAGWAAVREAEAALDLVEKSSGAHLINREAAEEPNPRPLPAREGEQEKNDPEAAAGFSSGGRPHKRDRRRGN